MLRDIINKIKSLYYKACALMVYGPYLPDDPADRTKPVYSTESEKFFEV